MTRIVIVDGNTLNPGDLSWDGLHALGEVTVHSFTPSELVVERADAAEIVLTNKTVFCGDVIRQLPRLKYLGVLATGYNVVDIQAASERGIVVTNVPSYGTESVAQMVFAHLLNLTQRVAQHAQTVVEGRWAQSDDFCYWDHPLVELHGQTMGLIGFGRIGQAVGRIARAFGMRVLAYDVAAKRASNAAEGLADNVELVDDLDRVFREADVVSLHCPLTADNEKLVNAERLASMKPTALLINTSRGPLIDEAALAAALNAGTIAGAGLDVLATEPPPADHPLYTAANCFITPHIAWATRAARSRLLDIAVENVRTFLAGQPQNVVGGG